MDLQAKNESLQQAGESPLPINPENFTSAQLF
jgi:hypothetical protein